MERVIDVATTMTQDQSIPLHSTASSVIEIVTLDDEIFMTRFIARIIKTITPISPILSYRVHQYQNGQLVLNDLDTKLINPSLFITDIEMSPHIDAYQFIHELYQRNRTEPVIIHSGSKVERDSITYSGSIDIIAKPADILEFKNLIFTSITSPKK